MPRRQHRKTMRGGFLDSFSSTLSGWWSKAKSSLTGSPASSSYSSTMTMPTNTMSLPMSSSPAPSSVYGGRRRTRRRRMAGGYADSESSSALARNAAPVSDVPTARAHIGGRTRRRKSGHKRHKRR